MRPGARSLQRKRNHWAVSGAFTMRLNVEPSTPAGRVEFWKNEKRGLDWRNDREFNRPSPPSLRSSRKFPSGLSPRGASSDRNFQLQYHPARHQRAPKRFTTGVRDSDQNLAIQQRPKRRSTLPKRDFGSRPICKSPRHRLPRADIRPLVALTRSDAATRSLVAISMTKRSINLWGSAAQQRVKVEECEVFESESSARVHNSFA